MIFCIVKVYWIDYKMLCVYEMFWIFGKIVGYYVIDF